MRAKTREKILAMLIAIAMVFTPLISGIGTVHAEGGPIPEKEAKCVKVTNIRADEDLSSLTSGDRFNLVLTMKNDTDQTRTIESGRLALRWNETTEQRNQEEIILASGEEKEIVFPTEASVYGACGDYRLTELYYFYDEIFVNYQIDPKEGSVIAYCDALEGEFEGFAYQGEASYTIVKAEQADTEAPRITGVSVLKSSIETLDTEGIKVEYTEDVSGVRWISALFETADGDEDEAERFYWNAEKEGQYVGSGSVETAQTSERTYQNVYTLKEITISDYAENYRTYVLSEDGQMMVESQPSGEKAFPTATYSVATKGLMKALQVNSIVPSAGIDLENVAAGDEVKFLLDVYNNSNETIGINGYGTMTWKNSETGYDLNVEMSCDEISIPANESTLVEVSGKISKYVREGKFELSEFIFGTSNGHFQYSYSEEKGGILIGYYRDENKGFVYHLPVYYYSGDADFEITTGGTEDKEAAHVTAVRLNKTEVGTLDEIIAEVDYQEDVSGISDITLMFETDEYDVEYIELHSWNMPEGKYVGKGTVEIKNKQERKLNGNYRLTAVTVDDYAGNRRTYWRTGDSNQLVYEDGNGRETIKGVSYQVTHETEIKFVKVTDARIEAVDKNNMAAGDTFEVVLQVKNDMAETVNITGNIIWRGEESYGSSSNQWRKTIEIAAGETSEIRIPITIDKFAGIEKRVCDLIFLSVSNHGAVYYYPNQTTIYMDSDQLYLKPLECLSNLDYTVTKSETPDVEAPYMQSLKIATDPIESLGTVLMELKADEGFAKLQRITMEIDRKDFSGNNGIMTLEYYYFDKNSGTLLYSPSKNCYILKMELSPYIAEGEYIINSISLTDENEKTRQYGYVDGMLRDYETNSSVESPAFMVAPGEGQDLDFKAPILQEVSVEFQNAEVPGTIEYIMKISDESGIKDINVSYGDENGRWFRSDTELEKIGKDTYRCTLNVRKDISPSDYQLRQILLYDTSVRENSSNYVVHEGMLINDFNDENKIPYDGQLDLHITRKQTEETYIMLPYISYQGELDETAAAELVDVLKTIQVGGKVVLVPDSRAEMNQAESIIPTDALRIIKDSKLKVTIAMPQTTTEVQMDGANLTDAMIAETESTKGFALNMDASEPIYGYLEFGNAYDRAGYQIWPSLRNNTTIPFTVRCRVSEEFYNNYKDSNIRLSGIELCSEVGQESNLQILQENLSLKDDRYIDVEFAEGMEADKYRYYISTDTVKLYDYPLEVTATPEISGNTVQKGSSFDVNLSVTNKNETVMENVTVFLAMRDALSSGEFGDVTGTYEITEANVNARAAKGEGNVTTTPDGDALIKRIEPGETVELTAKITIPKDADVEFGQYMFVASSGESEEELESYGVDLSTITFKDSQEIVKGDINEDGVVDVSDLMYMLQVVSEHKDVSSLTENQLIAGDVAKNDRLITVDDLMKLLQFVSERIATLD